MTFVVPGYKDEPEPKKKPKVVLPSSKIEVTVYTDGAHHKATNVGGSAFVVEVSGHLVVWSQASMGQTTARAELYAAVQALKYLQVKLDAGAWGLLEYLKINAHTDNQMVQKGFRDWLVPWSVAGWTLSNGGPVANQDLWKEAMALPKWAVTDWHWVKGHSGVLGNELCDYLAGQAKSIAVENKLSVFQNSALTLKWAEEFLDAHGKLGAFTSVKHASYLD